jgi:hypothetical protein
MQQTKIRVKVFSADSIGLERYLEKFIDDNEIIDAVFTYAGNRLILTWKAAEPVDAMKQTIDSHSIEPSFFGIDPAKEGGDHTAKVITSRHTAPGWVLGDQIDNNGVPYFEHCDCPKCVERKRIATAFPTKENTEELYITPGTYLVAAERAKQIRDKGYTIESDTKHIYNELLGAALAYMRACTPGAPPLEYAMQTWPWSKETFKPGSRVNNLRKAAALLVAALDVEISINNIAYEKD